MKVTGVGGGLKHGYQTAAVFGNWSLSVVYPTKSRRLFFSAFVVSTIEPWLDHSPLDLSLSVDSKNWLWSNVQPQWRTREGGALRLEIELSGMPIIMKEGSSV